MVSPSRKEFTFLWPLKSEDCFKVHYSANNKEQKWENKTSGNLKYCYFVKSLITLFTNPPFTKFSSCPFNMHWVYNRETKTVQFIHTGAFQCCVMLCVCMWTCVYRSVIIDILWLIFMSNYLPLFIFKYLIVFWQFETWKVNVSAPSWSFNYSSFAPFFSTWRHLKSWRLEIQL